MLRLQPSWAWTPKGVVRDPIVEINDGTIVGCLDPSCQVEGPIERLEGRLLMPGFVNAHSHAFQRAIRGRVEISQPGEGDFWGWREAMYKAANAVNPDQLEHICQLAFLEMVQAGVTHVGEFHYLHRASGGQAYAEPNELAHRVIRAARQVGLRISLLRVVYGRSDAQTALRPEQQRFKTDSPDEALRAIEALRTQAGPFVSVGLAPHSVRAVPPEWLPEFACFDGVIHAHVSEQPAENASCRAETGRSPTHVFADAGLLTHQFSAVHLTHPEAGDVDRLAAAGASVVVCPTTEMALGDGFLPEDARVRLPLAVGSDSHATIDLLAETRTLEWHGRAQSGRRHVLANRSAEAVLKALTAGGSRSLGGAPKGVTAGAPADLVALDLRKPAAVGVPELEVIAYNADNSWVDSVWVNGDRVLTGGRHPREEAIVQAARGALADLWA